MPSGQGAGESPFFSPKHKTNEAAKEDLLHIVRRDPRQLGQEQTRWTLDAIRKACDWLSTSSVSGVWYVLKRLRIGYKLGRDHVHSPDPNYVEKLADVQRLLQQAVSSEGRIVLVFNDQLTFFRQPTQAKAWEEKGKTHQPLARRSLRSDTKARLGATVNAATGKVTYLLASRFGIKELIRFYQAVRAAYPQAERIYLVLDNWPVHFHPDVLAALEPQQTGWELKVPTNWPTQPSVKARRLNLPIQLVPLPTYASWANPQEKVWRHLQQAELHLHRLADQWDQLKERVCQHLDQFKDGSQELLRYIGLTKNSKLYGSYLSLPLNETG